MRSSSLFIRPFIAGMLIALIGAACWAIGQARADCPQGQVCVYLPSVGRNAPMGVVPTANAETPTPSAPTPLLWDGCEVTPPAPIEGLQVWVSDAHPEPRQRIALCSRLAVNGRWVGRLPVQIITHHQTGDESVLEGLTSFASPPLYFYDEDAGQRVRVDVAAQYIDRLYLADTSYIAPPVVTNTPTPMLTITPSSTPAHTPIPSTSTPIPPTITPSSTPNP